MVNPYESGDQPVRAELSDKHPQDIEGRLSFVERRAAWLHNALWILCAVIAVAAWFLFLAMSTLYDRTQ